jgi:Mn2+/Fe2+ NRAMP family transporter
MQAQDGHSGCSEHSYNADRRREADTAFVRRAVIMSTLIRLVVVLLLVAIVASLGSALFHLSRTQRSDADSSKMARALTLRIALSLVLFVLLMAAWYAGLISPHGLAPR